MATKNIVEKFIQNGVELEVPSYESKTAVSGGTEESLVTTGEKYSWNQKVDSSDVLMKNNTTSYTPTGDYNPSTKKYVDDIVGDIETLLSNL